MLYIHVIYAVNGGGLDGLDGLQMIKGSYMDKIEIILNRIVNLESEKNKMKRIYKVALPDSYDEMFDKIEKKAKKKYFDRNTDATLLDTLRKNIENKFKGMILSDELWKEIASEFIGGLSNDMKKEIENESIRNMFLKELWKVVLDFNNYYQDIRIASYMAWGIINSKSSDLKEEVQKTHDKIREEKEDGKNKKIYSDIEKFFPFEIKKNDKDHNYYYITTWCREYQQQLWNELNRNIFAINHKNIKIGYYQIEKIYNELKKTDIENLLLFEMTVGFGLTNTILAYLEEIGLEDIKDIERLEPIIEIICSIPGINMRNNISKTVFHNLLYVGFEEERINEMEKILKELSIEIKNNYDNCLEIYIIYFVDTIKKKQANIFDYTDFLHDMKQEIKEEQERYWEICGLGDFPDREYNWFYERSGISNIQSIYSYILEYERLLLELSKHMIKASSGILHSDDPDLYDLKKKIGYPTVAPEFIRNRGTEGIIRSDDGKTDQKNLFMDNEKIIKEEVEKILIKKKKENDRKAGLKRNVYVNTRYAYLQKLILYHLLNDMSNGFKIPALLQT